MKKLIMVAGLLLILGSCYNDKYDKLYPINTTVTCDTTTIGFAHDIMPILNASCNISGGCHDAAGYPTSGYNFTTYDGIQGIATTAILIGDINWTPGSHFHNMPDNGVKLDQCTIDKITRWVNQGAQNN
jgi:hypothetical protein